MPRLIGITGLLLVVAPLLLVACAPRAPAVAEAPSILAPMPAPAAPMPPAAVRGETAVFTEGGAKALSSIAAAPMAEERMIVRNGDISLVVKDVVAARDGIAQLAVRRGGYVVSSWIAGEGQEMRGSLQIRVPDEEFEPALGELRKLAVRVDSESTNSRDVTEEYIDLEARLKNARATESQYLALLDKAKDVEDILRIYDSLSRVRSEIEQIEGRMKYLERTSSMSLINAQLRPLATAKPLVPVGWSALEALKSAIRALATFGQGLMTVAIWLLLLLPIWGTILGIFLWRRRRKGAQ